MSSLRHAIVESILHQIASCSTKNEPEQVSVWGLQGWEDAVASSWMRLQQAIQCQRHQELPASKLVLLEPSSANTHILASITRAYHSNIPKKNTAKSTDAQCQIHMYRALTHFCTQMLIWGATFPWWVCLWGSERELFKKLMVKYVLGYI